MPAQRLEAHWSAVEDLTKASDHVQQAVTAFINGGLTGVGLGESKQKFANNLPFPHTDSIFAVIGEELGLLGTFLVIALFVALIYRGFYDLAPRAGYVRRAAGGGRSPAGSRMMRCSISPS